LVSSRRLIRTIKLDGSALSRGKARSNSVNDTPHQFQTFEPLRRLGACHTEAAFVEFVLRRAEKLVYQCKTGQLFDIVRKTDI